MLIRKKYIQIRMLLLLAPACIMLSYPNMARGAELRHAINGNDHREHILLHTDRDIYIAGETAFFDIRLTADNAVFQQSRFAYLALRGPHGSISHIGFILKNGQFHGSFYLSDTLSTNYYEVVSFTNWMRNFGEESYSRKTIFITNRFDSNPTLDGLGSVFGKNDNLPTGGVPHSAPQNTDGKTAGHDDPACLITNEGLPGKRQAQRLKLAFSNREDPVAEVAVRIVGKESIDLDQLTAEAATFAKQTWPDNGNNVSGSEIPWHSNGYRMETLHQFVSGRVVSIATKTPAANARVILNTPDTNINILYEETQENGTFNFSVNSFYYGRDLFFTVDPSTADMPVEIIPDNKFQFEMTFSPTIFSGLADKRGHIAEWQEVVNLNKMFGVEQPVSEPIQMGQVIPARLFSNPVYSIYPSDYEPLMDLREISRELVAAWRIRSVGSGYTHALIDETNKTLLEGEPVVFFNGIISFDISPFIHLGSKQIHEIQIHNLKWVHGDMHFPGIISIVTTSEALTDIQIPETFVSQFLDSPIMGATYAHPEYNNSHIVRHDTPDLKLLRYWKPDVVPDKQGIVEIDWYTGDLTGSYLILVYAYTKNGNVRVYSKEIDIK